MSWLSKAIGKVPTLSAGLLSGSLTKKGGGFSPTSATLYDPFAQEEAKKLYEQTQSAYNQQQAFVNALAQQNALANQANVFKQLQDVASGVGPNPALAALQQATGQNIAGQAALMGGQRGASRNVGLLARQAGQQGGALQQQAAGQGATLQAQQQLGALGQLGGLANQQVAQQQTGLAGLNQFGLQGQQNILDAIARQNAARITQQNALNEINAEMAAQRAKQQAGMLGGALGALGTIGGALIGGPAGAVVGGNIANTAAPQFGSYNFGQYSFAKGGEVPQKPKYALGGMAANQPQSYVANYFANPNQMLSALNQSDNAKEANLDYSTLADGGAVYRSGNYANGGMAPKLMIEGGHVPGKALVPGDSIKNDIVDAKLSPGEIVIPRSIVHHPNAPELAAKFVRDTIAKGNFKKKKAYNTSDGIGGVGDDEEDNVAVPDIDTESSDVNLASQAMPAPIIPSMPASYQAAPALPSTPEASYAPSDLVSKGYQRQARDVLNIGKAEEEAAKAQAIEADLGSAAIDELMLQSAARNKTIDDQRQALINDISSQKVDPDRYFSNMSTGKMIGTSIGLILGGIGAGLTGGENPAMKFLDNAINRDIEAQKAELGKKQNLLTANFQYSRDMRDAEAATKAMILDLTALKIKQAAGENPIYKARAQLLADQLTTQADMLTGPMKAKETLRGIASVGLGGAGAPAQAGESEGPDPMTLVTGLVPERHQEKVLEAVNTAKKLAEIIPLHDQIFAQAAREKRPLTALEETGEDLRKKAELVGKSSKVPGAKELYAAAKAPGAALQALGSAARATAYALPGVEGPSNKVLEVQNLELLRDLVGRVNETEISILNNLNPQFSDNQNEINIKGKQRKQLLLEKYNKVLDTAKAFGIDLTKFPRTNLQYQTQKAAVPEAAKQFPNGVKIYNWSKQNINDPRAKAFLKKIGEL